MEYLPKIEYNEKRPSTTYNANVKLQYDEFLERLEELFVGDVWSVIVNDEIIFNSYEPKNIKAQIQESIIKNHTTNFPHLLFANMISQKKDGYVHIYMSGYEPWFIIINYNATTELLKVNYYKSLKYSKSHNNKEIILF